MKTRTINEIIEKIDYVIPKKYRPIPFWSWNEKLDDEETKEQILKMDKVGIGGFFMHARGGLQTEYMGDEWFKNVAVSIETARECGMRPWAYDENGWPSGFGNGLVTDLGVTYQQKYLRMESEREHIQTAIGKCGKHYFYYEVNPHYVDVLDKQVIGTFIKLIYQPYYEKFGTSIEGFFTDEPQISRKGIPWSFVFEAEYQKRYGETILECLEQLFLPIGDYKRTRVKFWKMVTELFSESYFKQIYDWCETRGLKLTGHLLMEGNLHSQLFTNGACMPHYEFMHIPGMDWLGREIRDCLTARQVSSVAEQLGKESVLSETYALCGHNVNFAELKGIYEWQAVRGINLLCQHLQGYSIRGMRKRDYPPAMYIQQPWWSEYDKFVEAVSRVGMIMREGMHEVDVLVLHPQTTAWTLYDAEKNEGLDTLNAKLLHVTKLLEEKHIEFHYGDEIIMQRHAKVENGKLVIGEQSYAYVVDPGCEVLLDTTKALLDEFDRTGGIFISSERNFESLPQNPVTDTTELAYTKRCYEDCAIHYFVNSSGKRIEANVMVSGQQLDVFSGELKDFSGRHSFEPWGSLMLVEPKNQGDMEVKRKVTKGEKKEANIIKPEGIFRRASSALNSLTLDKCDYYFDSVLQEENGYVLNICERANALGRPVNIHQEYHIKADYIPEELYLVCETPEKFIICVNGTKINSEGEGYFVDKSFQKISISKFLKEGDNLITFDCVFAQAPKVYENIEKAKVTEVERNKLVYDMEIEAVYLLGDFSIRMDGRWTELERTGVRYQGEFVIDRPKSELEVKHIEKQGYPFFAGEMVLVGEMLIAGENPVLELDWKGLNVVKVEMNGLEKTMLTDNRLPLQEFQVSGRTKVKFTLINNLRNLLGPHHLEVGEDYAVRPASFYKEPCVWNRRSYKEWNEDYCFVEMSL